MCAASAASASVVSLWMHDAPSGVGVGWVMLSTRYHVCDPSPPRSCSIASFRLWPLAIIPHKRNEQASGVKRRDGAHTVNAVTTTHCRASRKTELHCRSPARPKPLTIGNGDSYHASALASHVGRLFRWAPGTRSALTVQGLTRPVRERRSQGEGRTPRTVSTRPTPRSAAPGLLTRTPPTRCAFR